jgi:hypothetical protein
VRGGQGGGQGAAAGRRDVWLGLQGFVPGQGGSRRLDRDAVVQRLHGLPGAWSTQVVPRLTSCTSPMTES